MAETRELSFYLRIRNLHEYNPHTHLLVTPIRHKDFLKEEYYTYECWLVKLVAFLFPTKMEPVSISRAIIADKRTNEEISYATFGMRFGNMFGSSSSPYGSVSFDIDFIFILADGRMVETNIKDKNEVSKILPLLQQQVREDKFAKARREADTFVREAEQAQRRLDKAQQELQIIQQARRELEERIKERKAKELEVQKSVQPIASPETQQLEQSTNPIQNTNQHNVVAQKSPWQTIIFALREAPCDIRTVNQDGTAGRKWFYASVVNDNIHINKARQNAPSTTHSTDIGQTEFEAILPLYWKWRDGSITRKLVTSKTLISSYIFALIFKYVENVANNCKKEQAVTSKGKYDRDNFYESDSRAKVMLNQYESAKQSKPIDDVKPAPADNQIQPQQHEYAEQSMPNEEGEYQVGDIVEHTTFGRGRIKSVMLQHPDKRVNVLFDDVGLKVLNADMANKFMTIVNRKRKHK
jgi:hypothetical protein